MTVDKWLSHPTAIKIVSLALGILLWAVVHFDPESRTPSSVASLLENRTINDVKVVAINLDERNYVLREISPQKVRLTVRGTRNDLLSARTSDYTVRVDLGSLTAGTHTLPLRADLPRGIQALAITPSTVSVTIEELETKEFEVQVAPAGTPKAGYKAGAPVLSPTNRVHVTLPASEMERVDHVGASISIEGADATIKDKSVKLVAYDDKGKPIEGAVIDPAVLGIEVPITNPFKTVPVQFKLSGSLPPGLSIASFQPETDKVTIYGPQNELDKIDLVEADVKLSELTKSGKVMVPLSGAKGITEFSPKELGINVEIVLSSTRSLQGLPVTVNGLGTGLTMKITDPATGKVDITIQGAPAMLDRLQPGDVSVEVDLSGRGPGTYTVPLRVNLPRFIHQSGGNQSLTVEIAPEVPATTPPAESPPPDMPADGTADGTHTPDGSGSTDGTDDHTKTEG
nr:CdaR family protein [Cohnella sp. REN36]